MLEVCKEYNAQNRTHDKVLALAAFVIIPEK